MAKTAWFELDGFDALEKLMNQLGPKVSKKVQGKAIRAMSMPVLRSYRQNVRTLVGKVTRTMARSPGRRTVWYRRAQSYVSIIGPRKGKWLAPHAHLIEFGTGPRYTKTGAYRGQMPAYAPLRKAYDSNLHRVVRIAKKELAEGVKREAKVLARKHGTLRTK